MADQRGSEFEKEFAAFMRAALGFQSASLRQPLKGKVAVWPHDCDILGERCSEALLRVWSMAAHLRGYLVAASRGDGLGSATRARRTQSCERGGASLLVDGASNVLATAAVAGTVEHAVSNHASGVAHG